MEETKSDGACTPSFSSDWLGCRLITASPVWRNPGLAPLLMMEMYDRLCPKTYVGRRDEDVKMLGKAAWDEAAYCLDAPAEMPAGACGKTETGPDEDDWLVEQRRAWR